MMKRNLAPMLLLLLAACAGPKAVQSGAGPVSVQIIGFNDFHGNLEPPDKSVSATTPAGEQVSVPAGGAAYLASAIAQYRARNPNTLVLSAGDMIGASPITSSLFLDEPTIGVMNRIGVDYNALGNHEFDKGRQELERIRSGGCEKYTLRAPCQLEKYAGATFPFLAANVLTPEGGTLFPGTALRTLGTGREAVKVGIIGLPLKEVPNLASPTGLVGLRFADEVETINALVPTLKAQGADAIIVLIHQGLYTKVGANDKSCGGVSGDLLKILARLDPRVDLVVSGHTHWAYVCDYGQIDPARPFLITSAGMAGQYVTRIDLKIDPAARRVVGKAADNVIVQSVAYTGPKGDVPIRPEFEAFAPDAAVDAYVRRYVDAVRVQKERPVGRLSGSAPKPPLGTDETALGNLIADSQLAATRGAGAQMAMMNNTGIRADLIAGPDGTVSFGSLYAVQPFGNDLVTMTLTGAQMQTLFEQQLDDVGIKQTFSVSSGLAFSYDRTRPSGARIVALTFEGKPLDPAAQYRITVNSFLAGGGDSFTILRDGTDRVAGGADLDALEAWIAAEKVRALPAVGRTRDVGPAGQ